MPENYVFITKDNLLNRQNYMYSAFFGHSFIKEYIELRKQAVDRMSVGIPSSWHTSLEEALFHAEKHSQTTTALNLLHAWNQRDMHAVFEQADALVHAFEIRKRIHAAYNSLYKPIDPEDFRSLDAYAALAVVLGLATRDRVHLRYLNTLLKINDTLLSVENEMNDSVRVLSLHALNLELLSIERLMAEKGVKARE